MTRVTSSVKSLLLVALLLLAGIVNGQTTGNIQVHDTVKLEVIRLFPDSFPNVSVIFRASGPNGEAIHNLDATNVQVKEGGEPCRIVSVNRVSKNQAVNTALVVDHSGSMRLDDLLRRHWDSLPANAFTYARYTMREHTHGEVDSDSLIAVRLAPADPDWYHTPLWYAQNAATSYVRKTDPSKDQNSLIGFSTDVDVNVGLSTQQDYVIGQIRSMVPTGETAFYDAVSRAVDEADKGDGIRVIIAMTDGKDNNSRTGLNAVIEKAKLQKIPVYVIGLGDVDQSPLQRLARETGGLSYFTNNASTLNSIYDRITLQIQSIYEVVYESPTLSSADSSRVMQLLFDVDGKFLSSRDLSFLLPPEVTERIIAKEAELKEQTVVIQPPSVAPPTEIPWGWTGLGVAVLGAGVLSARYIRRRSKEPRLSIVTMYPNPASVQVTIEVNRDLSLSPSSMKIFDSAGTMVHSVPTFPGNSLTVTLPDLPPGNYMIVISSGSESASKSLVVTR